MNRIAFLVTAFAVLITPIALGKDVYMTARGVKQGQFKGEGVAAASGRIVCLGFEYEIKSPRDIATGQASGKRQHGTIRIIKEWGASSPLFHNALTTNDPLASVELSFTKTDQRTGQAVIYQTLTIANATVESIRQYVGPGDEPAGTAKHTASRNASGLEEITLSFSQGIVMTNLEGKTSTAPGGVPKAAEAPVVRQLRTPPPGLKPK